MIYMAILIYQADLRMRAEEFERIRRRFDAQRTQAESAGAPRVDAIIDDNQPWDDLGRPLRMRPVLTGQRR